MAKDRTQVAPLNGPQPLRPQATPVDTYHRPDVAPPSLGPTELDQLVGALRGLQPTIDAAAGIAHNKAIEQQLSEGEKAVLADKRLQNRAALKAAVDSGQLPAARNPWFLQGARQQVYRLQGETFDRNLREAYAQSDARNGDDISGFVSGFTEEYLKNNQADTSDPEMAKILTPMIERSQANLFAHHQTEREAALELQVETNTSIELGNALDKADELGSPQEDVAKQLRGIVEEQYKNGLSGTTTNKLLATSIARKAELALDPAYLDLLDKIPSGSGTVGQIGWVKDLRHETEMKIYQQVEHNDRVSAKSLKDKTEVQTQDLQAKALNALIDDPTANVADYQHQLASLDASKGQEVFSWQQARINGADNIVEDEDTVLRLTEKVYGGNGNAADIGNALRDGRINKTTAKELMKDVERSREFRSITNDRTVRDAAEGVFKIIYGSEESIADRPQDAIKARRAKASLYKMAVQWKGKNPDADEGDLLDFLNTKTEQLLKFNAPTSVKSANDSLNEVTVDRDNALFVPPEQVKWATTPLWASEKDLDKDILEYRNTKGTSGVLVDLATHLGTTPKELVAAQQRALLLPKKKTTAP